MCDLWVLRALCPHRYPRPTHRVELYTLRSGSELGYRLGLEFQALTRTLILTRRELDLYPMYAPLPAPNAPG